MTTRYPKNIWKYLKLGQKFTNFIPKKTPHNYQMVTIGWFSTRLFHETSPGPLETQRDNSEVCWYHGTGGVVGKPVAVHFVTSLVVVVGVVGVVVVAAIIIGGGGATGLLFVVWCLYLLLILFVVPAGWVRKEWSPYEHWWSKRFGHDFLEELVNENHQALICHSGIHLWFREWECTFTPSQLSAGPRFSKPEFVVFPGKHGMVR